MVFSFFSFAELALWIHGDTLELAALFPHTGTSQPQEETSMGLLHNSSAVPKGSEGIFAVNVAKNAYSACLCCSQSLYSFESFFFSSLSRKTKQHTTPHFSFFPFLWDYCNVLCAIFWSCSVFVNADWIQQSFLRLDFIFFTWLF